MAQKAFKVVLRKDDKLISCCARGEFCKTYEVGYPIESEYCLFVFAYQDHAEDYASNADNREVWKCEVEGLREAPSEVPAPGNNDVLERY